MIDIHTHILPKMDDGPRDKQESLALLEILKIQGITSAVLTPHFYPQEENLTSFLKRRQDSYEILTDFIALNETSGEERFQLILGSETYLSETLFSYDSIASLLIEETNYLLLELPYTKKWSPSVYRQIDRLTAKFEITPIIAHAERYEATQRNTEKIFQELVDLGCMLQFNIHSVVNRASRGITLKLIKEGWADFIGSDCHSVIGRPPEFDQFNQILERKLIQPIINQL